MGISWHRLIQKVEQKHLAWRALQDVRPSDNETYVLVHIINRNGQLIGYDTIGATHRKIPATSRPILANRPVHQIPENRLAPPSQPQRRPTPLRFPRGAFSSRKSEARTWINRTGILAMRRRRHGFEFLAGAIAGIRVPEAGQGLDDFIVAFQSLALRIGCERPAHIRTLVPVQAQPREVLHDRIGKMRSRTGRVDIFHAQHKPAPCRTDREPAQEKRPGVPQM